jgi:transcription factor E
MQVKLLHDLIEEMTGVGNGRIVEILFGKKDVNEFTIAKKMELTINQVRNILYKLSADGLVSFIRKKDKRKGWYIYYWTLKTEKCLVKLEQSLQAKIDSLKEKLDNRERKSFYICKPCGIEVTEEKALEHGFTCEECAEVYELSDNSGPIRDTKARITRIEKDLAMIKGELVNVREKEKKKRARAQKKADKEEIIRKEKMKQARAIARKKIAAKTGTAKKKIVKKKVAKKKVAKKAGKKKIVKKAIKKKIVKKAGKKKVVKKAIKKKVVKKSLTKKVSKILKGKKKAKKPKKKK